MKDNPLLKNKLVEENPTRFLSFRLQLFKPLNLLKLSLLVKSNNRTTLVAFFAKVKSSFTHKSVLLNITPVMRQVFSKIHLFFKTQLQNSVKSFKSLKFKRFSDVDFMSVVKYTSPGFYIEFLLLNILTLCYWILPLGGYGKILKD